MKRQYTLEDIYGEFSIGEDAFEAAVLGSLHPRSSDMLHDALGAYGLKAEHILLDAGCRDAAHTIRIVKRYGCKAIAFDPLEDHIRRAERKIEASEAPEQITLKQGWLSAIPVEDDSMDWIWCRDVLTHVADLDGAFHECARVLKPGGRMLIYATMATDLLEPHEAERLFKPLAVAPGSMREENVEAAWEAAGLTLVLRDPIGSEWREFWEEDGTRMTSKQLLKIAHLRRDRERLIQELGETDYEVELADCHWGVYQMLGKTCPMLWILELGSS